MQYYACALGFSTPTAIMVGVGIESNYGCLVIGLIDINSDVFNIVYNEVSLIVIAIKHHQLQIYYRYQFKLHEMKSMNIFKIYFRINIESCSFN